MAGAMKRFWSHGFTLIEVTIAMTVFAIFASSFLISQGYNVSDSELSEEQLKLHMLCEKKMNELIINPPKFTNALQDTKETKTFEEEDFTNYSFTIEWKKLKVPDFAKLFAAQGENKGEGDDAAPANDSDYFNDSQKSQRNSTIETMVFTKLKENLEKILWQVRLTVTNKENKTTYTLSRWVTNHDEPVQLNLGF